MKATASAPKSLQFFRSSKLSNLPWLVHGFSTRHGGVSRVYGGAALNLGFTKDDSRTSVERNRELFLQQLLADRSKHAKSLQWALVTARQIHSDLIHHVTGPEHPSAGDGLITDTPGLMLAVLTADCLPVIVVDQKRHAIGVFHAGWRGTAKRIVQKGVGEMQRHFRSDPKDMLATIGPGIQSCCYQVGEEVRTKFAMQFAYADALFREVKESDPVREKYPLLFLTARAPGHGELPTQIFLDLVEANRRQLADAGVPPRNLELSGQCTSCHPELLFSHRAESGCTGRMMGAAGIVE